jgi:hypothetical protein
MNVLNYQYAVTIALLNCLKSIYKFIQKLALKKMNSAIDVRKI